MTDVDRLASIARSAREDILRAIHLNKTGHAGSSLSAIEILVTLYFDVMRHDPARPDWDGRDWFVMSKGHGAPAYYAVLAHAGYFPRGELMTLRQFGGRLHGHPKAGVLPGVDVSTGSLGQGLSIALGIAMGLRHQGRSNRVFCLLGDGELQEGQNWEALMAASAYSVSNLTAIVDRNCLQNDKPTEQIVALEDLVSKAQAFGWHAVRLNGHDFRALRRGFDAALAQRKRPSIVIADTVKGKGVSFMENVVKWHHHPISDQELEIALTETKA